MSSDHRPCFTYSSIIPIMHLSSALITTTLLAIASASPIEERRACPKRASCPDIHIFGSRETTAPVGYGSAGTFVDLIKNAYAGSTSEAIVYPAAGGTNSAYASSVQNGTQSIANQINAFNKMCPNAKLVVVGYSQVCNLLLLRARDAHMLMMCLISGRSDRRQRSLRRRRLWPRDHIHQFTHHICRCFCH